MKFFYFLFVVLFSAVNGFPSLLFGNNPSGLGLLGDLFQNVHTTVQNTLSGLWGSGGLLGEGSFLGGGLLGRISDRSQNEMPVSCY